MELRSKLRHCVRKLFADDVEGAVDLVRHRIHSDDRAESDQGRDQRVLNEVLSGIIPVECGQKILYYRKPLIHISSLRYSFLPDGAGPPPWPPTYPTYLY